MPHPMSWQDDYTVFVIQIIAFYFNLFHSSKEGVQEKKALILLPIKNYGQQHPFANCLAHFLQIISMEYIVSPKIEDPASRFCGMLSCPIRCIEGGRSGDKRTDSLSKASEPAGIAA